MKKSILSLLLIAATLSLAAQEEDVLRTKKGVPIKPEAGDFAFGIDATPFFRFAGNLFAGNNPYSPSFGFTAQAPGAIFAKYKASATTTYRGVLLIGYSTETDRSANFTDPTQTDKITASALTIGLSGGIEKHRDIFGRLSGYYGAQAGIRKDPYYNPSYGYGRISYKDGNDSNLDFKRTGGNTYSIIIGALAGVEFYIAPRIALSGEFGYAMTAYFTGDRVDKPATGSETTLNYGGRGFDFEPISSGNLILLFYF